MAADARRVVIIDPAFLGDVVFDGPLVRALRTAEPGVFVGLVVRPPADAVARAIRGVDRVHVFDKRGRDRGLSGLRRVGAELADTGYDTALIPHPSLRSAMLAAAARIPVRVGSTSSPLARWLLTEHRAAGESDTFVGARLRLVAGQGEDLAGTMQAEPAQRGPRRRVGLVLGSQWPTKRWAIARAAELVAGLDRSAVDLVLIGAPGERPLFDELARLVPLEGADDTLGTTVEQMIRVIAGCDLVIAGDTGPLHIARALGVPVIALFGPTAEARHRFAPVDRVLSVELACRPCSAHGGLTCPEGHHRCMRDLEGARVLGAVVEALARGGAR